MKEILYEKFDVCQIVECVIINEKSNGVEIEFKNVHLVIEDDIEYLKPHVGEAVSFIWYKFIFDYKKFLSIIRKFKKCYL